MSGAVVMVVWVVIVVSLNATFLCTQKLRLSARRRKRFGAILVYTETGDTEGS